MGNKIFVFTDGGSRGNHGQSACAFVIKNQEGIVLEKRGKKLGVKTNNEAEYYGVIFALEYFLNNKTILNNINEIVFYVDSKLVVSQLNGLFKVKDQNIRNFVQDIYLKENQIGNSIKYNLIPRGKNFEADKIVNETLDSF